MPVPRGTKCLTALHTTGINAEQETAAGCYFWLRLLVTALLTNVLPLFNPSPHMVVEFPRVAMLVESLMAITLCHLLKHEHVTLTPTTINIRRLLCWWSRW